MLDYESDIKIYNGNLVIKTHKLEIKYMLYNIQSLITDKIHFQNLAQQSLWVYQAISSTLKYIYAVP